MPPKSPIRQTSSTIHHHHYSHSLDSPTEHIGYLLLNSWFLYAFQTKQDCHCFSMPKHPRQNNRANHGGEKSPTTQPPPGGGLSKTNQRILLSVFVLLMLPLPFLIGLVSGELPVNVFGQASTSFRSTINSMTTTASSSSLSSSSSGPQHQPPPQPQPSSSLINATLDFLREREQAYEVAGQHKHWKMRGHGHLYTYQKIALTA